MGVKRIDERCASFLFSWTTVNRPIKTVALHGRQSIAPVAAHVLINVVGRYGAPARLRSDRGSHFVNEIIEELVKMLDMVHIITPPYRPQANGMIERSGKETGRHLRAIVRIPQVKLIWSVVIPLIMRIVNNAFRDYLGCCPNDLMYLVPPAVE